MVWDPLQSCTMQTETADWSRLDMVSFPSSCNKCHQLKYRQDVEGQHTTAWDSTNSECSNWATWMVLWVITRSNSSCTRICKENTSYQTSFGSENRIQSMHKQRPVQSVQNSMNQPSSPLICHPVSLLWPTSLLSSSNWTWHIVIHYLSLPAHYMTHWPQNPFTSKSGIKWPHLTLPTVRYYNQSYTLYYYQPNLLWIVLYFLCFCSP